MFFDEIDGLCSTRNASASDSGVSGRVLSQFLAEMDGIEELTGVFVLAATNRPDMVDRRCDVLVVLSKQFKSNYRRREPSTNTGRASQRSSTSR